MLCALSKDSDKTFAQSDLSLCCAAKGPKHFTWGHQRLLSTVWMSILIRVFTVRTGPFSGCVMPLLICVSQGDRGITADNFKQGLNKTYKKTHSGPEIQASRRFRPHAAAMILSAEFFYRIKIQCTCLNLKWLKSLINVAMKGIQKSLSVLQNCFKHLRSRPCTIHMC